MSCKICGISSCFEHLHTPEQQLALGIVTELNAMNTTLSRILEQLKPSDQSLPWLPLTYKQADDTYSLHGKSYKYNPDTKQFIEL